MSKAPAAAGAPGTQSNARNYWLML